MTQAQRDAHECGIIPEETDARFLSQHLSAYTFTRQFCRGKRVLEVGFGDGFGSNYLAEVAEDVTGIDLAPGNIPRASAKYPRPNLRFLQMEGEQLSFPDDSFDVIGSFQVIEHIPEPQLPAFLTGIRRVLKPDGVCCLSTLNLEHNMKPGRPYEKLRFHEKEFTATELQSLLTRFFHSVELYGLYMTPRHAVYQRLKRWGLMNWGPARINPVARFYDSMTVDAFQTNRGASRSALDLIAVCRKTASQSA